MTHRALPILISAGLLLAAPAAAQEEPDSVVELEPIRVRVLRSPLGSGTPAPISVVRGDELTRGHAGAFLEEALRALPGLQIQNRFNLASGERLMIRGFGSRAQFGIRGVRILVDGIPATLPDGQTALDHLDPGGLGRVELLRGPASAQYGNAAGGVLHIQTLTPSVRPSSAADVALGSHGLRTLRVDATGGLPGAGAVRVAVHRFDFDGFRRNPVADDGSSYGGAERTVLNATASLPAGPGFLRLVANGLDMDARNPGSLSRDVLAEGQRAAHRFSVLQRTDERVRQGQMGVTWKGVLGETATELSAWGIRRELDGRIPPSVIDLDRSAGGVRALVDGSRTLGEATLSLGGGAEAEFQRDDRRNWDNDGGEAGGLTLDQLERVRALGIFTQARLDLPAGLALSAGVRYDRFRFQADDRLTGAGDPDDSGTRVMDAVSPTAGLVWVASPRVELFASASRSFETPTTTELVNRPTGAGGFNPDLDPQRGTTVEGGLRGRLSGRWSVEATLFQTELSDELVPFEVPTAPGRSYFRNAGASRHRGWEVTVDGRPAEAVSLRAAYTRVDARFLTFTADGDDFSGNRVPGLAPWRVDGRLTVEGGPAFFTVRALLEDDIPVDNANTAVSQGHLLVDLRVGMDGLRQGGLTLSPYAAVTNVLDRRYNASVVVNAFGGRYFEPGPPRSLQLGVGIRWSR